MVFTRRLYELDEVQAALLISLKKRRVEEALFWLGELELSAEDELAAKTIFDCWFLQKGVCWWAFWPAWISNKESIEGRRALVRVYCRHDKDLVDSSLFRAWCLGFLAKEPWDTTTKRKPSFEWWASGKKSREECAETWFDCLKPKFKAFELEFDEWDIQKEEEACKKNLRNSRQYMIPYDAHYGFTRRGLEWDSTSVLRNVSLYALLESPIWAGLLEEYVTEDYEWKDDSAKEDFYDTYFKDCDIPDEWSKQDQEKSHGLPPSKRNVYEGIGWWNRWVPENHKYIWGNANRLVMNWVRDSAFHGLESLENLYSGEPRSYEICTDKIITYKD